MAKLGWVAAAFTAVLGYAGPASGFEPISLRPPPADAYSHVAGSGPAPTLATPSAPTPVTCTTCDSCGGSCGGKCRAPRRRETCGSRFQRLFDWLTYRPLNRGCVATCCLTPPNPPPLYVFFPCREGKAPCSPCETTAGKAVYYAKQAGASGSQPIAQAGHGEEANAPPAAATVATAPAAPKRLSTYRPDAIPKAMPVLSPDQFRKPHTPSNCVGCGSVQR